MTEKTNVMTDLLAGPCDACGKPIVRGYMHCPKCNIHLFFVCGYYSQNHSNKFTIKCLKCSEEFK